MVDTQRERRNFPGYEVKQYYTLDDIIKGDTSGATDSDDATDPSGKNDQSATRIYSKEGGPKMRMNGMSPRTTTN